MNDIQGTAVRSPIDGKFVVPSGAYCWNIANWYSYSLILDYDQALIAYLMLHGY